MVGEQHRCLRRGLSPEQVSFLDLPLAGAGLNVCRAVPGSGKSTTLGNLVARAFVDEGVSDVVVLTSAVSSKNTALVKIHGAFEVCGIQDCFSENFVRTFHSVALRRNNAVAGRPFQVRDAKPFVEQAVDAILRGGRLKHVGCDSWTEYWNANAESSEAKRVVAEMSGVSNERRGLALFKRTASDRDNARVAEQCDLKGQHPVSDTLAVRSELTNRMLAYSTTHDTRARVMSDADRLMEDANAIDHATSIARLAGSTDPVLGTGGVLFVDEAQDLTACQVAVVLAALRAGARVVLLGDPAQGVYGFAGANSDPMGDIVKAAAKEHFEVNEATLTQNYRSTKQILAAARSVLPDEDSAACGGFSSSEGRAVKVLVSADEAKSLSEAVRALLDEGRAPREIAVIRFRNFNYKDKIPVALSRAGIPAAILGLGTDKTHPATRTLALLLCVLSEEDCAQLLERAVHALGGKFSPDLSKAIAQLASVRGCSLVESFLDVEAVAALLTTQDNPPDKRQRTLFGKVVDSPKARHARESAALFKGATIWIKKWVQEAIQGQPFSRSSSERPAHALLRARSRMAELLLRIHEQFVHLNNRESELQPLLDEAAAVDKLDEVSIQAFAELHAHRTSSIGEEEHVLLSTIHKFKGRERPVVIVCGLDESMDEVRLDKATMLAYAGLHDKPGCGPVCDCPRFRFKRKQLQAEALVERKRLLYVALSRPREELVLSAERSLAKSLVEI
jgi:superfamily I DNA/RNA helicase